MGIEDTLNDLRDHLYNSALSCTQQILDYLKEVDYDTNPFSAKPIKELVASLGSIVKAAEQLEKQDKLGSKEVMSRGQQTIGAFETPSDYTGMSKKK